MWSSGSGTCVAATTMPPRARWARSSAPTRSSDAASSPTVGSSSSQSGARSVPGAPAPAAASARPTGTAPARRPDPPGQAVPAPRLLTRPRPGGEPQILRHRQSGLHRVQVAEIGHSLGDATAGRSAHPPRPTAPGRRPAAPARPAGAAASICPSRWRRPAPAHRLPARRNPHRGTPAARRGRPPVLRLQHVLCLVSAP